MIVHLISAEDKALQFAEHVGDGRAMNFDPAMPGPCIELKTGERMQYESWSPYDLAFARGWVAVSDELGRIVLTWAGEKAVRKWQRKRGRA